MLKTTTRREDVFKTNVLEVTRIKIEDSRRRTVDIINTTLPK